MTSLPGEKIDHTFPFVRRTLVTRRHAARVYARLSGDESATRFPTDRAWFR